jgi:hypothetical protein
MATALNNSGYTAYPNLQLEYVSTASGTVGGTGSETTLIGTGVGSLTLPANFFTVGKSIRIKANGYFSDVAVPGNQTIKIKLGSTAVLSTGAVASPGSTTTAAWWVDAIITCRTTGSSGTVFGQGTQSHMTSALTTPFTWQMRNTAATTIDTTAAQTIDLTQLWSTSDAGNTSTCSNIVVESYDTSALAYQAFKRVVQLKVFDDAGTVTTGDGKMIFMIPLELTGMNLVDCEAFVTTVSSSGLPTVQLRNVTDAVDMLTTKISIDANENSSLTAATPPVIDTTKDDVVTGDLIAVDVDVAGTGAKGLGVLLSFQLP